MVKTKPMVKPMEPTMVKSQHFALFIPFQLIPVPAEYVSSLTLRKQADKCDVYDGEKVLLYEPSR